MRSTKDWLYVHYVHEKLSKGGEFPIQRLGETTAATLSPPGTGVSYRRFELKGSIGEALVNTCEIPESAFHPSIDSYVIIEDVVWMFQTTRNRNCHLDLRGIMGFLKCLSRYGDMKANG